MRLRTPTPHYWRLASYYFFHFATVGAILPYWPLYLAEKGVSAVIIGSLMATVGFARLAAPYWCGWLVDHGISRSRILRWTANLTPLAFLLVLQTNTNLTMLLSMTIYSCLWVAGLPQFEATTLDCLGEQNRHYSRIRLWGSIGFMLAVTLIAVWINYAGIKALPYMIMVCLFGVAASAQLAPAEQKAVPTILTGQHPIWPLLRQPAIWSVLLITFFMQLSFGPYYTFFSLYLEEYGYNNSIISYLWSLGVIAEIVIFWQMAKLLDWLGVRTLLACCLISAVLRWLGTAYGIEQLGLLIIVQLLHGISFGAFHAAMIHLIHKYFQNAYQGRGQALYSSIGFGIGGALSAWISGLLWQTWGGAVVFTLAACTALCGLIVLGWRWRNIY